MVEIAKQIREREKQRDRDNKEEERRMLGISLLFCCTDQESRLCHMLGGM